MNITKHAKKRYVERIKGITNINDQNRYLNENDAIIIEHLNKMIEYSTFLYKGQIGRGFQDSEYYISGNYILVSCNNALMTLYEIDFNFPRHINDSIRDSLLLEVKLTEDKLKLAEEESNDSIERKKVEMENIEFEIAAIRSHLETKEQAKKILQEEIKLDTTEIKNLKEQLKKYINMLCNSIEYKKAMGEAAKL